MANLASTYRDQGRWKEGRDAPGGGHGEKDEAGAQEMKVILDTLHEHGRCLHARTGTRGAGEEGRKTLRGEWSCGEEEAGARR